VHDSSCGLETLHIFKPVQIAVKRGDGEVFIGAASGDGRSPAKSNMGRAQAFQRRKDLCAIPGLSNRVVAARQEFFHSIPAFYFVK